MAKAVIFPLLKISFFWQLSYPDSDAFVWINAWMHCVVSDEVKFLPSERKFLLQLLYLCYKATFWVRCAVLDQV